MDKHDKIMIVKSIKDAADKYYGGKFDYLVNWNDEEFSWIHIVDDESKIDVEKEGWNLWITLDEGIFMQIVNNANGNDYHILTPTEQFNFMGYFVNLFKIKL